MNKKQNSYVAKRKNCGKITLLLIKHCTALHSHTAKLVNTFNRHITLAALPLVGLAGGLWLGFGG